MKRDLGVFPNQMGQFKQKKKEPWMPENTFAMEEKQESIHFEQVVILKYQFSSMSCVRRCGKQKAYSGLCW